MSPSRGSSEGYPGRAVLDLRGISDKPSLILHPSGSFSSFNEGALFLKIFGHFLPQNMRILVIPTHTPSPGC